jgi:diguanylate cyclase (GGDEF)-like protein
MKNEISSSLASSATMHTTSSNRSIANDATEAGWRAAWALHLTRPAESFALASTALDTAIAAGHANDAAWAQLCRALAGYRLSGADIKRLTDDFAEASMRMKALNSARGQRLASIGPAVLAMKQGHWPQALAECEKIAGSFDLGAMDPDNFYLLLGLSTSHVYCGNLVEGLRFGYIGLNVAQYLELAAEEATICMPLGVALMAARDHEEATEIFNAAEMVAARIDSPMLLKTIRTNLVFVLRRTGNAETIARADELIKLVLADPCAIIGGQQFAHYAAAELAIVKGELDDAQYQHDQAHAVLQAANGNRPFDALDQAKISFINGMIAVRRGRVTDAINILTKVVALMPEISAWRFSDRAKVFDELAGALALQGRFEEAYATQKKSSQDYLLNVDALNRSRRVSMQAREEMRRVQLALEQESQERRRLQNSHSQLRAQMDRTAREAARLKDAAMQDPLTGLPNRRHLEEILEKMLVIAKLDTATLAIAYLDIDHFKNVNDHFGHAMGDEVLRGMGNFGPHFLRGADVMSRIGGEEFCVVLIGCGLEAAGKRLTDLLDQFRARQFECDGRTLSGVTFSGGVAVFPEDGHDVDTLLKVADRRLYHAKNSGRAQVRCADCATKLTPTSG